MAPCCRAGRPPSSWIRRCWPSRPGGTGGSCGRRPTGWTRGACWPRSPSRPPGPGRVAPRDQLSGGRAILAVGVGAVATELPDTGEVTELRARAERLDEGIDLIRALWDGRTEFHGRHYRYQTGRTDLTTVARPVQERIPLWVVGVWPPVRRRCAGRCAATASSRSTSSTGGPRVPTTPGPCGPGWPV